MGASVKRYPQLAYRLAIIHFAWMGRTSKHPQLGQSPREQQTRLPAGRVGNNTLSACCGECKFGWHAPSSFSLNWNGDGCEGNRRTSPPPYGGRLGVDWGGCDHPPPPPAFPISTSPAADAVAGGGDYDAAVGMLRTPTVIVRAIARTQPRAIARGPFMFLAWMAFRFCTADPTGREARSVCVDDDGVPTQPYGVGIPLQALRPREEPVGDDRGPVIPSHPRHSSSKFLTLTPLQFKVYPTRAIARGGPNVFIEWWHCQRRPIKISLFSRAGRRAPNVLYNNIVRLEEGIRTVVSASKSGGVDGAATPSLAESIRKFWVISRRIALFGG